MKDLKERVLRGGLAKAFAQGTNFVVRVGSLIVLARLLDPKAFGLVGMVTAITGVLNLFRDFGLSTAAVQRVSVTEEQSSTLFWINILVGSVLGLILAGTAPLIVRFYHEPRLFWITIVLATGFLFNAAGVQHSALLQRQMRFTALATIDIIGLVLGTAVGIGLALRGFGPWSLVFMTLTPTIVATVCMWFATKWIPGRPRKQIGLRSMMRFGGTVTLNGLVVYFAYNIEKVLLGRRWGAEALGTYGRAYQLISVPTDNMNSAVGEVAFSALSRLQNEPKRMKSYFLKGYSLVLALTLPATLVCGFFAKDIIQVLLGPKWASAAPIFRWLAPTILSFAMINPFAWLLFALGRVERSLKIALVIAPIVITAILIGMPYGPKGVAIAYSVAMVSWIIPHIVWCIRDTDITLLDVTKTLSRPLFSGIVATVLSSTLVSYFGQSFSPLPRLVLELVTFGIVYLGMLLYVMGQKSFYWDLARGFKASAPVLPTPVVVD
jgi:O-antigen/teichoic acid export membrane protein